ncbi:MAG: hypothetical protein IKV58_01035 [Oscillospiraceae bacterium]|nr:hypothetical protein [Oscillospiraceae bacterium]
MSSLAYREYDLETFGQSARKPEIERIPKAKALPKVNTVKVIAVVMVAILACSAYLYGRMKLNEVNTAYTQVMTQIDILNSEKVRLDMALNEKMSLKNIEEYAQDNLGLKKLNVGQVHYISLEDEVAETADSQLGFFEKMSEFAKDVWNKLAI